jgi:hypothetical protein
MQRRKNKKENEREKLFQVKRKRSAQKVLARADIVRDVRFARYSGLAYELTGDAARTASRPFMESTSKLRWCLLRSTSVLRPEHPLNVLR